MRKLYVPLHDRELAALKTLAARERRRPQDQAAVLLGIALVRPDGSHSALPDQPEPGPSLASIGGPSDGAA